MKDEFDTPDGVWISGNMGWAEYCKEGSVVSLKNQTPLKAYVPQDIVICELASFSDFRSLCEQLGIDFGPFSGFPLIKDPFKQGEKYGELFDRIQSVYDGIHLSWNGYIDLREIFNWGCDSTVIFDPANLEVELLTLKELRVLGWDKYGWIITKEQLSEK